MIVRIVLIDDNFIMDDFCVLSFYEHYILIPFCRFLLGREIKLQLYKDLRSRIDYWMRLKYIVNVRVSSDCLYHSIVINSTIVWTLDLMNLGFSGQDWTLPTRRLATQRYINSHLVVVVFLSCLVKESQNIPRPL